MKRSRYNSLLFLSFIKNQLKIINQLNPLQGIFDLFINQLAALGSTDDPSYSLRFYLLERLQSVRAFALLIDLDDQLYMRLYDTFFEVMSYVSGLHWRVHTWPTDRLTDHTLLHTLATHAHAVNTRVWKWSITSSTSCPAVSRSQRKSAWSSWRKSWPISCPNKRLAFCFYSFYYFLFYYYYHLSVPS
jgi:hypothetical protein